MGYSVPETSTTKCKKLYQLQLLTDVGSVWWSNH